MSKEEDHDAPERRAFGCENEIDKRITKLAIVQEMRIMDKKLDKLISYLDVLVNQDHKSIIVPINANNTIIADKIVEKITHQGISIDDIERHLNIGNLNMARLESRLLLQIKKLVKENKCQKKKNTKSESPKKISTGLTSALRKLWKS